MNDAMKTVAGLIFVVGLVAGGIYGLKFRYDACLSEGFGAQYCAAWIVR